MLTVSQDFIDYVDNKICDFIELNKWDKIKIIDKINWTSNYIDINEKYFAYSLLNKFIYHSESEIKVLCERLMRLFQKRMLTDFIKDNNTIPNDSQFKDYLHNIYDITRFTYITGETPSPCDSGYLMCRYYRDIRIPQDKIIFHNEINDYIGRGIKYFIFVDDLIGSGRQAINYWEEFNFDNGTKCLQDLAIANTDVHFFYLSLIGTERGLAAINMIAPQLNVIVAELLKNKYSILSNDSIFWKNANDLAAARDCLNTVNNRSGINNDTRYYPLGYGDLSLAVAFSHSIPDNTLPIFYAETPTWKPLIRRHNYGTVLESF